MPPIQMPEDRLKALDGLAKRFYQEAIRELKGSQGEYTAEEMEMLCIHMILTLAQDMQANNIRMNAMTQRLHNVAVTIEDTFNHAPQNNLFNEGNIFRTDQHFNVDSRFTGR